LTIMHDIARITKTTLHPTMSDYGLVVYIAYSDVHPTLMVSIKKCATRTSQEPCMHESVLAYKLYAALSLYNSLNRMRSICRYADPAKV